jgi:hypothetical protein
MLIQAYRKIIPWVTVQGHLSLVIFIKFLYVTLIQEKKIYLTAMLLKPVMIVRILEKISHSTGDR